MRAGLLALILALTVGCTSKNNSADATTNLNANNTPATTNEPPLAMDLPEWKASNNTPFTLHVVADTLFVGRKGDQWGIYTDEGWLWKSDDSQIVRAIESSGASMNLDTGAMELAIVLVADRSATWRDFLSVREIAATTRCVDMRLAVTGGHTVNLPLPIYEPSVEPARLNVQPVVDKNLKTTDWRAEWTLGNANEEFRAKTPELLATLIQDEHQRLKSDVVRVRLPHTWTLQQSCDLLRAMGPRQFRFTP